MSTADKNPQKVLSLRFLAPLLNVNAPHDAPVDLGFGYQIRPMSRFERETLKKLRESFPEISLSDHMLECRFDSAEPSKDPSSHLQIGRKRLETAISLFRLFSQARIGFNLFLQAFSDEEPYGFSASALLHYRLWWDPSHIYAKVPFLASPINHKPLREFFADYNARPELLDNLAVSYFNKSYIEPYTPRDALVDLVISLEHILLCGEKQELGYKLALRGAYVIAPTDESRRREVFRDLKDAYSLRSSVVHGSDDPEISLDFFLRIREYTRQVILFYLEHGKRPGGPTFDNRILSGVAEKE